jgi:hypothetical protein
MDELKTKMEDMEQMKELEISESDKMLKEQMIKLKDRDSQYNELELEQGALKAMVEKNKKEI